MRRTLAGAHPRTVVARTAAGLVAALLLALWCAPSAGAHTRLESTAPAAGSTSSRPVTEVTLRFTLPVSALGDGVVIDGPEGTVEADVAGAEDGLVLTATPRDALGAGDYTVTWNAAAQDGHPLEGSFGFTVTGAGPSGSPDATGTPSAGATTPGEVGGGAGSGDAASGGASGTDGSHSGTGHDMDHDPAAMDSPATDVAEAIARLGSAAALWGGLVAAGGLVFTGFVLRGRDPADVAAVLRLVRWAGVLVLPGLAVRVMAGSVLVAHGDLTAAISPSAIGGSLTGTTLRAVGLQAAGALAVAAGAWRTLPGSWLAVLGAVVMGAGHVVSGHSNTVEPRWLIVIADVAHLAAAATWVGGVVAMGLLLRVRRRRGREPDAALLGARFSVVAAVSVTVVGAAGVLLAAGVLDRPAQLWESSWGLLLLAKVGVVLVVGAIGAYHHFGVVPRLTARRRGVVRHAGRSRTAGTTLRRSAGRETTLMVVVVLLTAWLVGASVQG
ncbi:copper resistance CopC/CopD family protein [Myceligenerans pegani]|uniref:Copper resistance protein CopC n=1 Tax=Myceligenerans pegani TaxID=2776917 RepID=A0ABR9MY28_9MICO|nr:copper resistance protein CopC [Myceligenerans sp. TRM 65318]MBE1876275.1 copper resistance protein CopC [Myceligenerans sp. TRM 65318]MBE3018546.1 copper resistance protein CopC [Myceligenerans sp. TRM 65318]